MAALRATPFLIHLATSSTCIIPRNRVFASRFFSSVTGLPYHSIEKDPEDGSMTVKWRTENERIEIKVEEASSDSDSDSDFVLIANCVPPLKLCVKVLYGENYNRCFTAQCVAFPWGAFAVRQISIRSEDESEGRKHLEEFEDFFKKRGFEPRNFNFLLDFISKRKDMKND